MNWRIFLSLAALSLAGCAPSSAHIPAVRDFDSAKYMGKWYEIARLPHRFERGLDRVSAEYSAAPDGSITVTNRGMRGNEPRSVTGKAKLKHPDAQPPAGELRVSFFGPFYSDYRVMLLDADYQWALIGSGSAKYLWILSRTPELPKSTLDTILAEAQRRGYDTSKLIW